MTQGGLVGALDPTLVLELPSEQALTRLCRAVASLPAQGPHRLRLRELGRELIPNSELYPTERSRRCPARVTLKNVPAPGATAAVALAKRLVLDLLNRGRPLDEAEVFMVGGSASQSGGPSSRSWTVFLPLLDPAVAQQVVAGLHQRVVNKFTIMAWRRAPRALRPMRTSWSLAGGMPSLHSTPVQAGWRPVDPARDRRPQQGLAGITFQARVWGRRPELPSHPVFWQ